MDTLIEEAKKNTTDTLHYINKIIVSPRMTSKSTHKVLKCKDSYIFKIVTTPNISTGAAEAALEFLAKPNNKHIHDLQNFVLANADIPAVMLANHFITNPEITEQVPLERLIELQYNSITVFETLPIVSSTILSPHTRKTLGSSIVEQK